MATFELTAERMMLTGPSDQDLPKLQALGYDPAAIAQAAQDRADNEAAYSAMVPDRVRRHPTDLLDRVLARELNTPDMVRAWRQLAAAYGMRVFDALPEHDPVTARALTRSMPGAEVAGVLKTARHRDATRTWRSNDMSDIDALTFLIAAPATRAWPEAERPPQCGARAAYLLPVVGLLHECGTGPGGRPG